MDREEMQWFVLGFLALAGGNAIGAVYMFRGNVLVVMLGVSLMVGGYQLMHYGSHSEGMVNRLSTYTSGDSSSSSLWNWGRTVALLLFSVYFISQGFVIGSQATKSAFTLVDMGSCGALIVGGYVTGHMAIHGEVL